MYKGFPVGYLLFWINGLNGNDMSTHKQTFKKWLGRREVFPNDAMLCLCRYKGCTAASIANGEHLERIRKRGDFFKAMPATTGSEWKKV